ncbi:saccharopine dehydrogenase [Pseudoalteromonas sp. T1lg75]|uniref:saccharopine dehydrogenase n=1 Tax=Pseudoalteromonas sp. T1lg75 TaxID=2077102 RepID=UPI000CF5E034|nr:saccharopine dehydrogenase [Pseudoalteromonas sp. T1lg75]
MSKAHIWLRAETKPQEERTALTPEGARQLIAAGFDVTVEKSEQSIFAPEAYQETGVRFAEPGSWVDAPLDAIILGLKELPEESFPLRHRHIYFAHAYKEQAGWKALLTRFKQGGGELYDLEYLVDDKGRRIAAFGYWAGFAGAALALKGWINQQSGQTPPLADISAYRDKQQLLAEIDARLAGLKTRPSMMVIGAKGRSGSGAVDLGKAFALDIKQWDLAETQKGGPFSEINQVDILVNCVLINRDLPPFATRASLDTPDRRLSLIADVSCDPYGSYNPLPLYRECTTFARPCLRIDEEPCLDLIAIDHLPSLLPKESSEDYGAQLVPHLLTLDALATGVWSRALTIFKEKTKEI